MPPSRAGRPRRRPPRRTRSRPCPRPPRNECAIRASGDVLTAPAGGGRHGARDRAVAFTLEAQDDPVFGHRLKLAEAVRDGWVVLTYRGDPVARPRRPLLRLARADGRQETFVLPAPVLGAAHALVHLPPEWRSLELATDPRSAFVLERVGLRTNASLLAEAFRRRPLRALAAGFNHVRGDERRFRDILRGTCGVAPLADYARWAAARTRPDPGPVPTAPALRLILPAHPDEKASVAETIASLRAQTFTAWTLAVRWSKPTAAIPLDDARITQAAWVGAATLDALAGAAEAVALLAPGDRLDPDALAILVRALSDTPRPDLVYADAASHDASAVPSLKPDWSPDLARVTAYPGTPILYAGALLRHLRHEPLGGAETFSTRLLLSATEILSAPETLSAPEILSASEILASRPREDWAPGPGATGRVAHVPRVLVRQGPPDSDAGQRHAGTLRQHLARHGVAARVEANRTGFDLSWSLPAPPPLVSVVIPTRDRLELIRRASDDVLFATAYPQLELVIVDNGSTDPAVRAYYETLRADARVRILEAPGPFNFSALINQGVAASRGSVVVLLNNDIAVLREDWLDALVRQACRPDVGAVGAKLLHGDGTLQHAGVVVGLGGGAGHILRRRPADTPGHLGRLRVAHEVSAVTAACLAVERAKFDAVGGLDAETFPIDFNDVDFCLRLGAAGYRTIWTPHAVLSHLESTSRGPAVGPARVRFEREAAAFAARWRDTIRHDPYYHPGLALTTFGEELE